MADVVVGAGAMQELLQWVQATSVYEDVEGLEDDIYKLSLALAPPLTLSLAKSAVSSSSSTSSDSLYVVTALSSGSRLPLAAAQRGREPAPMRISTPSSYLSRATPSPAPSYISPMASPASAVTPPATSIAQFIPPHLDCRHLLNTTDWGKTPLGPRASWSPVLETMISIVFASPTQDALWLGPEFNMI